MAIVLLGKTRCALCGCLLLEGEDALSFPPLFYNQRDPAWVLNDAGVHRSCLVEHGLADRALGKLRDVDERRGRPKLCAPCTQPITDPDDFSTGPLGDGPDDPLQRELDRGTPVTPAGMGENTGVGQGSGGHVTLV